MSAPNSPTDVPRNEPRDSRHDTVVMVRWALAIACAYLVVFSERSAGAETLGALVIVLFLASNLVVGRLSGAFVRTTEFLIGVAVMDTAFIVASLYCAGQLSVELVVLFLGVLVVTIAGFRIGSIAGLTLGLTAVSLLIVWLSGSQPLWRSSMLLRVPFLLTAALVYAWLAEMGRHEPAAARAPMQASDELSRLLVLQAEAIKRCNAALSNGTLSAAQAALNDIALHNRQMLGNATHVQPVAQVIEPVAAVRTAA